MRHGVEGGEGCDEGGDNTACLKASADKNGRGAVRFCEATRQPIQVMRHLKHEAVCICFSQVLMVHLPTPSAGQVSRISSWRLAASM